MTIGWAGTKIAEYFAEFGATQREKQYMNNSINATLLATTAVSGLSTVGSIGTLGLSQQIGFAAPTINNFVINFTSSTLSAWQFTSHHQIEIMDYTLGLLPWETSPSSIWSVAASGTKWVAEQTSSTDNYSWESYNYEFSWDFGIDW